MRVIAIPNERYPSHPHALADADAGVERIADLTPDAIDPSYLAPPATASGAGAS